MRYSKFFGKTVKEVPADANLASHKLLIQAGFLRESVAGRYFFLPLGQRVQNKLVAVIREEMEAAGAQEMLSPVLHPLALWQETNRTNTAGFELMTIEDRRGAPFALGGTAEEMFVDVVRKFQISYKDLPFNIFQFSLKFRDELRARGGLLRVREFIMKDAYSFHADEADFAIEYKKMADVYIKIFQRLGLNSIVVESDNGYIGGDYCHEFIVCSDAGESRFLKTGDGSYAAHEDVAQFGRDEKNLDEAEKTLEEVEAVRGNTTEDGVALHNLPAWQQLKNVVLVDEKGRFIVAVLRGDYDVNETKLKHVVGAINLRPAAVEEIREQLGSEAGFISPVGLREKAASGVELVIVGDLSLKTVKNFYSGANAKNRDLLNINFGRDFSVDLEGDIAMAQAGYRTIDGAELFEDKGIEVGNIFQLGFHYSHKMKGALFTDKDGTGKPFYMGCYGIGVGRTLATIVEKYHDEKGIVWPKIVAPFLVHLVNLGANEEAEKLYADLTSAGVEVLFDDREESAGKKFADSDLIGLPLRLVVSARSLENGGVEWKERAGGEARIVDLTKILDEVKDFAAR
jgi:prolyl-tRNA synthetase